MKSILDRSFQYTPSSQTDLKKTFARIRRERKAELAAQERDSANAKEASAKVEPLRRQHGR